MSLGKPDAGKPPVRFDEERSESAGPTIAVGSTRLLPLRLLYCGANQSGQARASKSGIMDWTLCRSLVSRELLEKMEVARLVWGNLKIREVAGAGAAFLTIGQFHFPRGDCGEGGVITLGSAKKQGGLADGGTNGVVSMAVCGIPNGLVAQRLEQATHNRLVPGSNPGGPTIFKGFFRFSTIQAEKPLPISLPMAA